MLSTSAYPRVATRTADQLRGLGAAPVELQSIHRGQRGWQANANSGDMRTLADVRVRAHPIACTEGTGGVAESCPSHFE